MKALHGRFNILYDSTTSIKDKTKRMRFELQIGFKNGKSVNYSVLIKNIDKYLFIYSNNI